MEKKKLDGEPGASNQMIWRQLTTGDIEQVSRITKLIHHDLPERDEVFAERIKLYPEGCLALVASHGSDFYGYAISHPIRRSHPPALDTLLGEIAPDADQYYIHDVAILPEARGSGLAQAGIAKLFAVAAQYPTSCLISVYGTTTFWSKFGFAPGKTDETMKKKLLEYGEEATYMERNNS